MKIRYRHWDCELIKERYYHGRIALSLVAAKDDGDVFEGEPIATATVNIPEATLKDDEVLIKDYSENKGMLQTLINAGIVLPTGQTVKSGFVEVHVCKILI